MRPAGDGQLVQLVDAAFADAARRGGPWLACKPGCNQCCTGVFRISPLDVERLREGLRLLAVEDIQRRERIRLRAAESVAQLSIGYPGDPSTGILYDDDRSVEAFEDFANEAVCPALDPTAGTCDLYSHRPMTCRTFGPPVLTDNGGYGVCELCFAGASDEAVKAGEMTLPDPRLEDSLNDQIMEQGETIVAFALHRN